MGVKGQKNSDFPTFKYLWNNSNKTIWSQSLSLYGSIEIEKYLLNLDLLNVLGPPFCTLTTHSWLNWVDEDD